MKKLLLLVAAICFVFSLPAQSDLIVYDSEGKVKHKVKGERTKKLGDGDVIEPTGTLKVKRNASVTLLYGLELVTLSEKGRYSLAETFANREMVEERMGFGGDFLKNLGKTMLEDPPPPPPPPPGRKGVGGDDQMVAKLLAPKKTTFTWDNPDQENYEFAIYVDGTDALVMSQKTKSDQVEVDLGATKYQGKNFYWVAKPVGNTGFDLRHKFEVVAATKVNAIWTDLRSIDEYNDSSPVQKRLWEAVAFEEAQLLVEAADAYKEALAADPENELVKRMYAGFVQRYQ